MRIYQKIPRPVFFKIDPETVHDFAVFAMSFCSKFSALQWGLSRLFNYSHPSLISLVCGVRFENPIGLAAGFDKKADLHGVISSVGFGFIEEGSITGDECKGNLKPRLQ